MKILLAGAGGQVGRRVRAILEADGQDVAVVTGKDLTPSDAARGLAQGREVIVSCAGASVSTNAPDKRPYSVVDPAIHRNLILEAKRCGIKRFVYLGVHAEAHYADCRYIIAHEAVRAMLVDGEMDFTVVRPTGIYSAFADLIPFAKKGVLPLVGDGSARTNPIDPQDVAEVMVAHLREGPKDVPCGGPEVMSRRQINEVIAKAAGKDKVFMPRVPAAVMRLEGKAIGFVHPRMGELLEFFSMVATSDCVAPAVGKRDMASYFEKP
jgi:uncharacterized protein YbjT (DUF2867 family)